jgi:hypothetical protein
VSARQLGDELCGLLGREAAPVWLAQEADQFLVMRAGASPGNKILDRPKRHRGASTDRARIDRRGERGHTVEPTAKRYGTALGVVTLLQCNHTHVPFFSARSTRPAPGRLTTLNGGAEGPTALI